MKTATLTGFVLAAAMVAFLPALADTQGHFQATNSTVVKASATPETEFTWRTNADNTIAVAGYNSTNTDVTVVAIPDRVNGLPVTSMGANAFLYCRHPICRILTSVTIPESVTNIGTSAFGYCYRLTDLTIPSGVLHIGDWAFSACHRMTSVCFKGDAPNLGKDVFHGATNATVYYLEGTKGWGKEFGGRPTAVWKPEGGATTNGVPLPGTQR